jgi:hypothetical protein
LRSRGIETYDDRGPALNALISINPLLPELHATKLLSERQRA